VKRDIDSKSDEGGAGRHPARLEAAMALLRRALNYQLSIETLIEVALWLALLYLVVGLVWAFVHPEPVHQIQIQLEKVLPAGADVAAFGEAAALGPPCFCCPMRARTDDIAQAAALIHGRRLCTAQRIRLRQRPIEHPTATPHQPSHRGAFIPLVPRMWWPPSSVGRDHRSGRGSAAPGCDRGDVSVPANATLPLPATRALLKLPSA